MIKLSKLTFLLFFSFISTLDAQEPIDENLMKAFYIKTVIPYITWDKSTNSDYFTIAFFGNPKVKKYILKVLTSDSINSKKIKFINVTSEVLYKPYDILIVEDKYLQKITDIHPNTFSITDAKQKSQSEKIILKFKTINERLKFVVNFTALKNSTTKLSSRFLQIAYAEGSDE